MPVVNSEIDRSIQHFFVRCACRHFIWINSLCFVSRLPITAHAQHRQQLTAENPDHISCKHQSHCSKDTYTNIQYREHQLLVMVSLLLIYQYSMFVCGLPDRAL